MAESKKRTLGLITDFGLKGSLYVGMMKAVITRINPRVNIVDISHQITPFSIIEAGYVLKTSYPYFPEESIFIVVVDPGVGSSREILLVKSKSNHYFIVPNNGILPIVLDQDEMIECINVLNKQYFVKPVSNTFHGRDIFSPIAAHLSLGVPINKFGTTYNKKNIMKTSKNYFVNVEESMFKCSIQFIDSFGNLVTNISIRDNKIEDFPLKLNEGDKFTFINKNKEYVGKFSTHFGEVALNELLFLQGSTGYLEISLNQGNAAKNIGLNSGDELVIKLIRDDF